MLGLAKRSVASFRSSEYDVLIHVLREVREAAGVRHQDLAKTLGKGRKNVYSIEHFSRRVDPEEIRLIAVALEMEPIELFQRWLQRLASS